MVKEKRPMSEMLLMLNYKVPKGKGEFAKLRMNANGEVLSDEDEAARQQDEIRMARLREAAKLIPKKR